MWLKPESQEQHAGDAVSLKIPQALHESLRSPHLLSLQRKSTPVSFGCSVELTYCGLWGVKAGRGTYSGPICPSSASSTSLAPDMRSSTTSLWIQPLCMEIHRHRWFSQGEEQVEERAYWRSNKQAYNLKQGRTYWRERQTLSREGRSYPASALHSQGQLRALQFFEQSVQRWKQLHFHEWPLAHLWNHSTQIHKSNLPVGGQYGTQ